MPDNKLFGMFRAKVVENKDPQLFGRVQVWIPDIMSELPQDKGLWARAANNPAGGRNSETQGGGDNNFAGTSFIPKKGSFVWVFFEGGNENRPYYLSGCDLEGAKVLPECQVGSIPQDKWVIFKSHEGRCIVVSDDPDDARVEITGKKRQLSGPPSGDTGSVYTIDGNQTTILLDERDGQEQILIRTHLGDFVKVDITNRKLEVSFESDIIIKTVGDFHLHASGSVNIKGDLGVNIIGQDGTVNFSKSTYQTEGKMNLVSTGGGISADSYGGKILLNNADATPKTATPPNDPSSGNR